MLSFKPKYHSEILDGEFSGNWLPIFPVTSRTDIFARARWEEQLRIEKEGGQILIINPKL